jgi:hypothetical protein
MARLNNDQKQQRLAGLFATAGESDPQRAAQVAVVLEEFIRNERWDHKEAEDRIAHALSLVKMQVTWNPDIFEKARLIGWDIKERLTGANQDTGRAEMKAEFGENVSPETQEEIGQGIVALIEGKGVRTYHAAIGILLITVGVLMKRIPASNPKEQMKQAMLRWVGGL